GSSPVTAVMAIGVVWMSSSRKRAVTPTSWMPARSWLLGLSCAARGVLVRQPTAAASAVRRSVWTLRKLEERRTDDDGADCRPLANTDISSPPKSDVCERDLLSLPADNHSGRIVSMNMYRAVRMRAM